MKFQHYLVLLPTILFSNYSLLVVLVILSNKTKIFLHFLKDYLSGKKLRSRNITKDNVSTEISIRNYIELAKYSQVQYKKHSTGKVAVDLADG